jgi:calcineurin-like phosphoesterase family protein
MAEFWTSDNHWGHRNIITYCGRPFTSADGQPDVHWMNREMTERWNAVVGPRDTVFHLGDFSMVKHVGAIREYRKKLNGRIVLVRGNHDRSAQQMLQAGFEEVHDRLEIERDGLKLYMAHIPVLVADPRHPRKYSQELTKPPPAFFHYFLCGHVHEKWKRRGKVINVGVDQWDFMPRRLEELLAAT